MNKQKVIFLISVVLIVIASCHAEAKDMDKLINASAAKHGIDAKLFKAILMHESRLDVGAINYKTGDYGLGQINNKTIKAYGFNKSLLLIDKQYSIESAALVLSDFKKAFKHKEPQNWFCRYNVGYGKMEGKKLHNCNKYIKKVVSNL